MLKSLVLFGGFGVFFQLLPRFRPPVCLKLVVQCWRIIKADKGNSLHDPLCWWRWGGGTRPLRGEVNWAELRGNLLMAGLRGAERESPHSQAEGIIWVRAKLRRAEGKPPHARAGLGWVGLRGDPLMVELRFLRKRLSWPGWGGLREGPGWAEGFPQGTWGGLRGHPQGHTENRRGADLRRLTDLSGPVWGGMRRRRAEGTPLRAGLWAAEGPVNGAAEGTPIRAGAEHGWGNTY